MNTTIEPVLTEEGTSYIQELPSNEAVSNNVWTRIDQAFSEPVTHADNHADYAPTQILAEVLKEQGCDGVCYRSSLSSEKGFNIAFFNPDVAAVCDICLFEVLDIEVKSKKCGAPWIDPYSGKPITGC
jgi:RES domain